MTVTRYFIKLINRRGWLWVGLSAVGLSYLPWLWMPGMQPLASLLPVVTTTVCILNSQRRWPIVLGVSTLAALVFGGLNMGLSSGDWGTLASVVAAQFVIGLTSQLVGYMPWGYAQTHSRLTHRLRRQSEQLQEFKETHQSAERTVMQFESDRRALLEHLPVHVVRKNLESQFTFVSQSFCDLVDRSYEELVGKTDHDIFPPELADKFVEDDRRVMSSGGVFNDVEETQLPDGTHSYMQVRKAPLRDPDGRVVGVQGIFWDVTEEHTSRQELQRIEFLTRALINAALDAVLIVDADGHVLEANPASEKILGYTRDEAHLHPPIGSIMQTSLEEPGQRATDPPDADARYQRKIPIGKILRSATGTRIEAKLRRSDDMWFDGEISTHPLDVDGSQGWAIFIRDITRRKKAELELLSAKEAAEHANAAKSEFVANVSHELRTPLTGIVGLHELLELSPLEGRQREYLKLAQLSASNLLTLIDDLLDFSKIEAGHLDIESVPFSMVNCVEEAVRSLAARAQFKGLELLLDFAEEVPESLVGDPHRIKQVVLNLVGNGIKFTARGEIRIRVFPMTGDAPSRSVEPSRQIRMRIEIHDSGIGIPVHKRQKIFDAFHQADSSTTRRYGGTGLGLTICRNLVNKMGGEIGITDPRDVHGQPQEGSCFFLELPLEIAGSPNEPAPVSETQTQPSNVQVQSPPREHVVLAAGPGSWQTLLSREISRLGFEHTNMSLEQLVRREPAHLFAAGNHTIVVVDYRELSSYDQERAPVVTKWVLLSPLYNEEPPVVPKWLSYADVSWLSRPVRRQELEHALNVGEAPSQSAVVEEPQAGVGRSAEILLVEDSPISQTVLKDMLEGLGHQVQVVDNGRAAVRRCQEKLFDLVLMDIQMPDLDGLEATASIRDAESGLGRRQRICALTAHATASDRAQCEQAGMDGFLVKPISLESLAEAVQQALGGDAPVRPRVPEPPAARPDDQDESESATIGPPDKPQAFSLERALEDAPDWEQLLATMNGNQKLLCDVLGLLAREMPRLGRAFGEAVNSGNLKEARRSVHTLKSNVRHVGLTRIGAYAEQLEYLARDEQAEELRDALSSVQDVAMAVTTWAEELLKQQT